MTTQEERTAGTEDIVMLFKYLRELSQLKAKPVMTLADEEWYQDLSGLQLDTDYVDIGFRDRTDSEDGPTEDSEKPILRVGNPLLKKCPEPDEVLDGWLGAEWEDPYCENPLIEARSDGETYESVLFADDPARVAAAEAWLERRSVWAEAQIRLMAVKDLFGQLYEKRSLLENNSESLELMVGTGFITDWDHQVNHPVYSKRVKIVFDKDANEISVVDTDAKPELNGMLLASLENLSDKAANEAEKSAVENDYHPMDRNETPRFLKGLAHMLSAKCSFSGKASGEFEDTSSKYLVYMRRTLFLRKRPDGVVGAINGILQAIDDGVSVPNHLQRIVTGGEISVPDYAGPRSDEELFAEVGGESREILLTKEANREQLEIARRIDGYDAVLVQGPPGTGKTHTIANLMGHFLAQGKSVLVTSHTRKALSVLKDKLDEEMQGLCVSMLDDSHEDMERSVERITQKMSATTSSELAVKASEIGENREFVVAELWKTRGQIFEALNKEYSSIVYQGESMTPSEAARYVYSERALAEIIPGKASTERPIPLSREEISALYLSNRQIAVDEECEIEAGVPCPDSLMLPDDFSRLCGEALRLTNEIKDECKARNWSLVIDDGGLPESVSLGAGAVPLPTASEEWATSLAERLGFLRSMESWQVRAIADARRGSAHKNQWLSLIDSIRETRERRDLFLRERGVQSLSLPRESEAHIKETLAKAIEQIESHGKIPAFWAMIHRGFDKDTYEQILVDGKPVANRRDYELVLALLRVRGEAETCAKLWNDLMAGEGIPPFAELDAEEPERIAEKYLADIKESLDWGTSGDGWLDGELRPFGLTIDALYESSRLDSEETDFIKRQTAIRETILPLLEVMKKAAVLRRLTSESQTTADELKKYLASSTCETMLKSIERRDDVAYRASFERLQKLASLKEVFERRQSYLRRLRGVAPDWADAIVGRDGVHGLESPPLDYEESWKWRSISGRLDEICEASVPELQRKSAALGREYQTATAKLASVRAWEALLRRTESNATMNQALQGWVQTVRKIGKGTGKRAPELRAKARESMAQCQKAVPAWIMTINDALTTLDPKENRFDVVIVDEASQSGISALPILFMAKKAVIVGDDNQVSPVSIGVKDDEVKPLIQTYLSGNVPNDHLYTADTSLYDIAKTTFKPLMLKEHFRCVPDIIGFSNMLSYDYQIKPLRDAGSTSLVPAVVSQRAWFGRRVNKVNEGEIEEIVCLMRACMNQPEYEGKTFGVISLFSGDGGQAKRINQEVTKRFTYAELEERRFLCGSAADFQGDERDVIFLSMVDSRQGDGPLTKMTEGPQDSYKKRYNVAASRAKDQLWIVNSLDWKNDLKPGDLRRRLLEYADDPASFREKVVQIERESESPFEEAVAKALTARGFDLVQQWKVGAYRIDMVAQYESARVAIECDGERFHSTDEQIRNDMERQIILERAGWRFVRLRGSEYYRDPEKAIDWLVSQLRELGIEPAAAVADERHMTSGALLERVRHDAEVFRDTEYKHKVPTSEADVLLAAQAEVNAPTVDAIAPYDDSADSLGLGGCQTDLEQAPVGSRVEQTELPLQIEADNGAAVPESLEGVGAIAVTQKSATKTRSASDGTVLPDWVCEVLEASKIPYVDKRGRGGNLWVTDEGRELTDLMEELASQGARFTFKEDGGRVTKGKPGWWLANNPERKQTLF